MSAQPGRPVALLEMTSSAALSLEHRRYTLREGAGGVYSTTVPEPGRSSLCIAVTPSGRVTHAGTEPEGPITRGLVRNGTRFGVDRYALQPDNTPCLAMQGTPGYMNVPFRTSGTSHETHLVFRKPTDVEFAMYEATDADCTDPAGYVRDAWPQGEVAIRVDDRAVEGCVPRRDEPVWSSMRVALGVDGSVTDVGMLTCPAMVPLP